FLRQVGDLSTDKRKLGIPAEQPPKQAPAHLFERDEPPPAPRPTQAPSKPVAPAQPPTQAMSNMNLSSKQPNGAGSAAPAQSASKLQKEPEKKKRHFFSSKRG
ncbi:hypothetical protein KCV05_g13930, partial [Aureobasidium melanogenum]